MAQTRTNPHSTAPENFRQSYAKLSDSDRALITAMMSMGFALLKNVQRVQENEQKESDNYEQIPNSH